MKLNDNYTVSGEDLQEAVAALNDFKKNTKTESIPMEKITFMDFAEVKGQKRLVPLNPKRVYRQNLKSYSVKSIDYNRKELLDNGWDEDIVKEAEDNGMFIKVGKKLYPVSKLAYTSMANRAGITGPAVAKKSLCKSMLIAENFNSDTQVTLVKRANEDKEKVFAIMSGDYGYIRQDIISDIIQKCLIDLYGLGVPTCSNWEITQSFSRVYLDFPAKKKEFDHAYATSKSAKDEFIPGIMLETSDVGDCSFRIVSYLKINGNMIFTKDRYEKVHLGKINTGKIITYTQENILPNLTIYPDLFEKLSDIDLFNPFYPSKEHTIDVFDDLMKHCGLDKALGKKRMKKADEMLFAELKKLESDAGSFTAFDLLEFTLNLAKSEIANSELVKRNIYEYTHQILTYKFSDEMAA